jgi:acetoin utilization protein AcuB
MLVKDCMMRHPAMISPDAPAVEAQQVMAENKIRHLPVVGDGKRLVGLLTRRGLTLEPDKLGSLNVWEIGRYLSDLKVKKIMIPAKQVCTIESNRTVERAARFMEERGIGCLPVVDEDNAVIGLITESDLLRSYEEMLGLPVPGVRVTMRMPNQWGEFDKLMTVVGKQWGVMGIGTYPSPRKEGYYDTVIKIPNVTLDEVKNVLGQVPGQEIIDIRDIS